MSRPTVASADSLSRIVPVDRLDEQGLALYGAALSAPDGRAFRRAAVRLMDRLCELGYMRRLSREATPDGVRLRYRNLLTLDTVSVVLPAEPAAPDPTTAPRAVDAAPPAESTSLAAAASPAASQPVRAGALTLPLLRAVAASSRRTDLAGALGYLYELLKDTVECERVALCVSRGLASSQAGGMLEFEEVCATEESEQVAPPSLRDKVEASGETLVVHDTKRDPRLARHRQVGGSVVVAPLKAEAYVYGTLGVWSSRTYAFDAAAVAVVEFVAEFAAGLIKRRLEVEELIFIDQTCQIHNRRYFDEQLAREIERSRRTGRPMALLIGDLDDFKQVNDTLGHAAGDSVLRQVGKILSENARQVDIVARYGGEEFGVILPDVSRDSAIAVAERIRSTVAMHSFITGSEESPTLHLTISIGGALYPLDASSRADLMDKADRIALYQAKRLGKNRAVLYEDPGK